MKIKFGAISTLMVQSQACSIMSPVPYVQDIRLYTNNNGEIYSKPSYEIITYENQCPTTCQLLETDTNLQCDHSNPKDKIGGGGGDPEIRINDDTQALEVDPKNEGWFHFCYSCNYDDTTITASKLMYVSVQEKCKHFYNGITRPSWFQTQIPQLDYIQVPYMVNPPSQPRLKIWKLYQLNAGDCVDYDNQCTFYHQDCSTLLPQNGITGTPLQNSDKPYSEPYLSDIFGLNEAQQSREIHTLSDRFFDIKICVKCKDRYSQQREYNDIRFKSECVNGDEQFVDKIPAEKTQQVIANFGSEYFQLGGPFVSNIGPHNDPCFHTYLSTNSWDMYHNVTILSETDYRVELQTHRKGIVGDYGFSIIIQISWQYPELRPWSSHSYILKVICRPDEEFFDYPGPYVFDYIKQTKPTLQSQYDYGQNLKTPDVVYNKYQDSPIQNGCQTQIMAYNVDEITPTQLPLQVHSESQTLMSAPPNNIFKLEVDGAQHGAYQFKLKFSITFVDNPPKSTIFSDVITFRRGCGFHVQNTKFKPYIENGTEKSDLDFTFDNVWSYIDYSFMPPQAKTTPIISYDVSQIKEGGHLYESVISCGVNTNSPAECPSNQPINIMSALWNYHGHQLKYNECPKLITVLDYSDAANPEISNVVEVVSSQVSVPDQTYNDFDGILKTANFNEQHLIKFKSCPSDRLYTIRFKFTFVDTFIGPGVTDYQNYYISERDYTVKCHCHFVEQISFPSDLLLTATYLSEQKESKEYSFSIQQIQCRRSYCPYDQPCSRPICETPCKPFKPVEIVTCSDPHQLFSTLHPELIDETNLQTGNFTFQTLSTAKYCLRLRIETFEDTSLQGYSDQGGLLQIQGIGFSKEIQINIFCGPIFLHPSNPNGKLDLPILHQNQNPYIISKETIKNMFTHKCQDETYYSLYKDQECLNPLISSYQVYMVNFEVFITRLNPTALEKFYICAFFNHEFTNKVASEVEFQVCGNEKFVQMQTSKEGIPILEAIFQRGTSLNGIAAGRQLLPYLAYKDMYKTDSKNCPITLRDLVWKPMNQSYYVPLPDKYAFIDDKGNILISTKELVDNINNQDFHKNAYIRYRTQDTLDERFARLNITIFQNKNFTQFMKFGNTAPYFINAPPKEITQIIKDDPYTRIIKFSSAVDAQNDKIYVKTGGEFNETIMEFDPVLMELRLRDLQRQDFKTYNIQIILYDEFDAETKYEILLELKNMDISDGNFFKQPQKYSEEDPLIVKAKIDKITYNGYLHIKFSQAMRTDFNLSLINNTDALDIYVQPIDGRQDIQFINLTWSLVHFKREELMIKLNFTNFVFISPSKIQDKLVVFFNQTEFFASKEKQIEIDEEFRTLRGDIKKQVKDDFFTSLIINSAGNVDTSVRIGLVVSFIMLTQIEYAMIALISFLDSLQIIIHFAILGIVLPGNVCTYLSILFEVTQFDIFDTEWTTELILDFDFEQQEKFNQERFRQIIDIGYETHNIILNLGSVSLIFFGYCILLMILGILKIGSIWSEKCLKYFTILKKKLIFNTLISLLIDCYIFALYSSAIQIQKPLFTTFGEGLSVLFGYMMLFNLIVLLPGISIYVLTRPIETLRENEFKQVWGDIYKNVKTRSKYQIMYFPVFIFRRMLFIISIMAFQEYPTFQLQFLFIANLANSIYIGYFQALKDQNRNKLDLYNELLVSSLSIVLSTLIDQGQEEETKYSYGWFFISILLIYIIINMKIALLSILRNMWLCLIRYYRILKWKFPRLFCKEKKQPSMRKFEIIPKLEQIEQKTVENLPKRNQNYNRGINNIQDSQIANNFIAHKNNIKLNFKQKKVLNDPGESNMNAYDNVAEEKKDNSHGYFPKPQSKYTLPKDDENEYGSSSEDSIPEQVQQPIIQKLPQSKSILKKPKIKQQSVSSLEDISEDSNESENSEQNYRLMTDNYQRLQFTELKSLNKWSGILQGGQEDGQRALDQIRNICTRMEQIQKLQWTNDEETKDYADLEQENNYNQEDRDEDGGINAIQKLQNNPNKQLFDPYQHLKTKEEMEQEAYIQRRFKEIGYNFEEIVKEEYVRPEVTEEELGMTMAEIYKKIGLKDEFAPSEEEEVEEKQIVKDPVKKELKFELTWVNR